MGKGAAGRGRGEARGDVAEWRIHFVSVEPAGRKRFRASATTRSQTPSHSPKASPVLERNRSALPLL